MRIARNIEQRLERLADGLSATVFRGRMQPVDLANRLVRQADLMVTEDTSGPTIPNHFAVTVGQGDVDPSLDVERLRAELSRAVTETATDRGWRIGGPIDVALTVDDGVRKGSIKCSAASVPGTLPAWAVLAEHRGVRTFNLTDNRCVVGRSEDVDVRLDEGEVSRFHAVVFRQGSKLWILDLASANGTSVNGSAVGAKPAEIGLGDMLSFGPAVFAVKLP